MDIPSNDNRPRSEESRCLPIAGLVPADGRVLLTRPNWLVSPGEVTEPEFPNDPREP